MAFPYDHLIGRMHTLGGLGAAIATERDTRRPTVVVKVPTAAPAPAPKVTVATPGATLAPKTAAPAPAPAPKPAAPAPAPAPKIMTAAPAPTAVPSFNVATPAPKAAPATNFPNSDYLLANTAVAANPTKEKIPNLTVAKKEPASRVPEIDWGATMTKYDPSTYDPKTKVFTAGGASAPKSGPMTPATPKAPEIAKEPKIYGTPAVDSTAPCFPIIGASQGERMTFSCPATATAGPKPGCIPGKGVAGRTIWECPSDSPNGYGGGNTGTGTGTGTNTSTDTGKDRPTAGDVATGTPATGTNQDRLTSDDPGGRSSSSPMPSPTPDWSTPGSQAPVPTVGAPLAAPAEPFWSSWKGRAAIGGLIVGGLYLASRARSGGAVGAYNVAKKAGADDAQATRFSKLLTGPRVKGVPLSLAASCSKKKKKRASKRKVA